MTKLFLLMFAVARLIVAADLSQNVIDINTDVQDIVARPDSDQYNLLLTPELWQQVPLKIFLKDEANFLVAIVRNSLDEPLTIYALHEDLVPPEKRHVQMPGAPIHLHVHTHDNVEYGALSLRSAGQVSLYPGAYENLEVNAQHLAVKKDPDREERTMRVKRDLRLSAEREITQHVALNVDGSSHFSTRTLKFFAPAKIKGQGIISADIIEMHAKIMAGRSMAVAGRDNKHFLSLYLNDKLASEGEVMLQGNALTITNKGATFSKTENSFHVGNIKINGKVQAPFVRFAGVRDAKFDNAQCTGTSISLHADHMVFSGSTTFDVTEGMWFKGLSVKGTARFFVDRNRKRTFRAPKRDMHKLRLRELQKSTIEGMRWDVKSIDLSDESTFKIASGATNIRSMFAKIKATFLSGKYNRYQFSLNAEKYFSLDGVMNTFSARLEGMRGSIGGSFTTGVVDTIVDYLSVPGKFSATHLTSAGKSFEIPSSGSGDFHRHSIAHTLISVAGIWRSGVVEGHADLVVVENTGNAYLTKARVNFGGLVVDGSMGVSSLEISGNSVSVSESGKFAAGSITNYVPSWSLDGKAAIGSLYSIIPHFTLHGSRDAAIKKLYLSTEDSTLSGQLTINNADMHSGKLTMTGHLRIDDSLIDATLWLLTSGSTLEGRVQVTGDKALIDGAVFGDSIGGVINNLAVASTGRIASDITDLAGDTFNNEGAITSQKAIVLDYRFHQSFGDLSTRGILAFSINDRIVNPEMLNKLEQLFTFGVMSVTTDQFVRFTKDFHFKKGGLSISAAGIALVDEDPFERVRRIGFGPIDERHRSEFHVDGALDLISRDHDLNITGFNVGAYSLNTHTGKKMRVHNSALLTIRDQNLSADEGFLFSPLMLEHYHHHEKSTHWGFGSRKTTTRWNEVIASAAMASDGHIYFESKHGGADFDSTLLSAAHGVYGRTYAPIVSRERVLYRYTTEKKSGPLSFSRRDTRQEHDSPTIITSHNVVSLTSEQGNIHLPGTIIAAKYVDLDALGDVHLAPPTLHTSMEYESCGVEFSHGLKGVHEDPSKLMNLTPYTSATKAFAGAWESENPINMASAGIMGGVQVANAFNAGALLSSLGFKTSLVAKSCSYDETSQGQAGIFGEHVRLCSRKGNVKTLNGVPIVCSDLEVVCPEGHWYREGFHHVVNMDSSMGAIGFSPSEIVSFDTHQSTYSLSEWQPQNIDAKQIKVQALGEVNLDGKRVETSDQTGFGISVSAFGGGSAYVTSGNNHIGVGYSPANPKNGAWGYASLDVNGTTIAVPLKPTTEQPAPHVVKDRRESKQQVASTIVGQEHEAHNVNRRDRDEVIDHDVKVKTTQSVSDIVVEPKGEFVMRETDKISPPQQHNDSHVNTATDFVADATVLALGTIGDAIDNIFSTETSIKNSTLFQNASQAMSERGDVLSALGDHAEEILHHFRPEWLVSRGDDPKNGILAKHLRTIILEDYLPPLVELSKNIARGVTFDEEQLLEGFELVKSYYTFLKDCDVPYGKTALDIATVKGFLGEMTDAHFNRQAAFAGVKNIWQKQKMVSILLAASDARLRVDNDYVSSDKIINYHLDIYDQMRLPAYAWFGLLPSSAPGVFEMAANGNFSETHVGDGLMLARNLLEDTINVGEKTRGFSVPRMVSAMTDTLTCVSTPSFCPPNYSITDFTMNPNFREDLAEKWDVDMDQIKKIPQPFLPANSDRNYLNSFRFKIEPK